MAWPEQVVDWRGPTGAADVAAAFAHFSAQGNAASGGLPYWRQAGAVLAGGAVLPRRSGLAWRISSLGLGFKNPSMHLRPCWRQAGAVSPAAPSALPVCLACRTLSLGLGFAYRSLHTRPCGARQAPSCWRRSPAVPVGPRVAHLES